MKTRMERRVVEVWAVYVVAFLDLFAASMIVTVLASYLRDELGMSATIAGCIGSVYGTVQFFSSPIVGGWSDQIGYSHTIVLCLSACIGGYALLVSNSWPLLILSRAISGSFKHTQNLCRTYVASVTNHDEKVRVYGRLNAIGNIGFMFGPALAGWMTKHWGFDSVFLTATLIFASIALFVRLRIASEAPAPEGGAESAEGNKLPLGGVESVKKVFHTIRAVDWTTQWDLMLVRLLLSLTVLLYRSNFNWMLNERFGTGTEGIGYLTSYQGGISFLSSYFANNYIQMYRDRIKCFIHVILLMGFSLFGLWFLSTTFLVYSFFLIPLCLSTSFMRVISLDLTTERCGESDRGLIIGAGASIVSVSRALSPGVGGILHDFHPDAMLLVGILITCLSAFIVSRYTKEIHELHSHKYRKSSPNEQVDVMNGKVVQD